jgi:hypothetical protein
MITDCAPIFKPFEYMTIELSREKYPTLSLVIPLIRGHQHTVRNVRPETDVSILLKNSLVAIVARRLGSLEKDKIVSKSTLLDPKFKKNCIWIDRQCR